MTMPAFGRSAPAEHQVRVAVAVIAGIGLVLALPGVAAHEAFAQPTTLKYAASVAAPLVLLLLATASSPDRVLVPAAILAAPFAPLVMTAGGVPMSAFAVVTGLAVLVTLCRESRTTSGSATAHGAVLALALLLPAVIIGSDVGETLTLVLAVAAIGWITARLARKRGGPELVAASILSSATLQSLLAIYEFASKSTVNFYGSGTTALASNYFYNFNGTDRPVGSYFDPISLGNVLALSLPIAVGAAIIMVQRRRPVAATLTIVSALVILTGLVLSFSRMSWIGAGIGVACTAFALPGRLRVRAVSGVAVTAAVGAVIAVAVAGGELSSRFGSIFHPGAMNPSNPDSDQVRLMLWGSAAHVFARHPWFGVGINQLVSAFSRMIADVTPTTNAQNTYLQIAAEAGILGIAALVALAVGVIRDLRSDRLAAVGRAALVGSLVALAICWVSDDTVRYIAVAASIAPVFGLLSGLAVRSDEEAEAPA
ncbi:MAG TPA: O-antigen ligase family protein [Mycobacteriales bacterium]|nr:O-antigen ligase family protein [Mycobacteriales bacterium]